MNTTPSFRGYNILIWRLLMNLSRSTLVAVAVAVAVPSLAMPQRPSPAGVVRHVASAPVAIGTKKSVFADSARNDDRVEKGATIGAILGAVSGVALGYSLNVGCTPTVEGGDPGCSVSKAHLQWGLYYGALGAGAGALIGGAVGKLLTWL